MKISQIGGFLGSGKTSMLIEFANEIIDKGMTVAIIVNDVGDVPVDGEILKDFGQVVKQLPNGCICCQIANNFTDTIVFLHQNFNPDIVFVEPTGVALPWMVKKAAEYAEHYEGIEISHAPVITVLDAYRVRVLKKAVRRLLETQIREADLNVINKIDIAAPESIKETEELVQEINPKSKIIYTSVITKQGLSTIIDMILSEFSMRFEDLKEKVLLEREYGMGDDVS